MDKKIQITSFQFIILLFLFIIGDAVALLPSIQAEDARQDVWIVGFTSLLAGVLIILFIYYPASRIYPQKTFVECSEKILGTFFGKLITFLFILYSFYYACLTIRYQSDFFTSHVLPKTPKTTIYILFAVVIVMGVKLGIETIARSAEIFYIPLVIALIFLGITLISVTDIRNLQPILEGGWKPILRGSITFISLPFVELVFFLMIVPFVSPQEKVRKSWIIGGLLGGVFIVTFCIMCILVLGVNTTSQQLYPGWKITSRVHIGEYIQKVQIFVTLPATFSIFVRAVFCFYCALVGFSHLFKIKNYQPFALPFGILLVEVTELISTDVNYLVSLSRLKPFLDFFCAFVPVILMLIIGTIKKKRQSTTRRFFSSIKSSK